MGILKVLEDLHIKLESCKIGGTSTPFVDANGPDSRSSTYGTTMSLLCGGEKPGGNIKRQICGTRMGYNDI